MTNIAATLTATNNDQPRDVMIVAAVNPDGPGIAGGGATEDTLLLMTTILNELNADFGTTVDPAWTGTGAGTVISILKALHAQNALMITALQAIQTNTTP